MKKDLQQVTSIPTPISTNQSDCLLNELLTQIVSITVRDLAWVIASCDLMSRVERALDTQDWTQSFKHELNLVTLCPKKALEQARPHLLELDQTPDRLDQALSFYAKQHKRVRLGVYYEHLVYYWLEHILKAVTLHREIQLYRQVNGIKQTLGALDIVATLDVKMLAALGVNQSTQVQKMQSLSIHFELASKFYLQVPKTEAHQALDDSLPDTYYQYIGPNERDSFGGKLHRLFHHQLPLSQSKEALERFQLNDIKVDARCLFIKGRMFQHISEYSSLNYNLTALWLRHHEIPLLFTLFNEKEISIKAFLCNKPSWLAPPSCEVMCQANAINDEELLKQAQMAKGERGSTLWFMHSAQQDRCAWFMLVADDWGQRG